MLCDENRYDDTLSAYCEALDNGVSHSLVYCARAMTYKKMNAYRDMESDLMSALDQQPWLIQAKHALAEYHFKLGNYDEVLQLADIGKEVHANALRYDVCGKKDLAMSETLVLRVLLKRREREQALARVSKVNRFEGSSEVCFCRAMVYGESRRLADALTELKSAIDIDDGCLGVREAEDELRLQTISKHYPKEFAPSYLFALFPMYEERYHDATSRLEVVANRFQNETRAWYHLWNTCANILKYKATGKRAAENAAKVLPEREEDLHLLCKIFCVGRDEDRLKGLARRRPDSTLPLRFLLRMAIDKGDQNRVTLLAESVLKKCPGDIEALTYLLRTVEKDSEKLYRILDKVNKQTWFHFESLLLVAKGFLERGYVRESRTRCFTLLEDGLDPAECLLLYSIAAVADEV